MKNFALFAALLAPSLVHGEGAALSGPTGLLTVPTAEVQDEGAARFAWSRHNAVPTPFGDFDNYIFSIGFLPGLELGGRVADQGCDGSGGICDLSFLGKYQVWKFDGGPSLAVGGQDIGGAAQNFRSTYAVATWPWRTLSFTAGHGWGPDVLKGTLGGIEWRPWPFLGVYAEYDTDEVNPGVKFESPPLWGGLRIGANAGYRGATDEVEGGIEFSLPLGKRSGVIPSEGSVIPSEGSVIPSEGSVIPSEGSVIPSEARDLVLNEIPRRSAPRDDTLTALRAALEDLGFESIRTGTRADGTLVVSLENRRYNHSTADGIGLALGAIATSVSAEVERVDLTLSAYGVPQVAVAASAPAYRDFLREGVAAENLVDVRHTAGAGSDVRWHNSARPLSSVELVVEPVLRTFVATEYGVLDTALGARARLTAPLGHGAVAHAGLQAPLARTDDFRDGENFAGFGPEAGLDLFLVQYAHKPAPGWTWLWSAGRMQVFQVDLTMAGLEQAWISPSGRHRLNGKFMFMDSGLVRHEVALAGYTLFDARRRYSAGVTGGRFYADDSGVRLDLNRYFGDTIAGLFLKIAGEHNLAAGFQLSLPLTPRRDAAPRGLQLKGPRRWGHSLQSTLHLADGSNALKPLMLYEPTLDFDLRRDFLDSGRLGAEYLDEQLPRMREAYLLWGEQ